MIRNAISSKGITRRSLLKWAGLSFGGAALSGVLPSSLVRISKAQAAQFTDYTSGTWKTSCCNMCGGQCGIEVYVEGGAVRKIEPQGGSSTAILNPNAVANVAENYVAAVAAGDIGRLCCKGNSGIKSLYDPDRLQTPLKRVGARGSDDFVAISWDEAITLSAQRLAAIRGTYGARSLVWFGEDHSFTHIQQDFCDAFGSPNYSNHANLCDTSRKAHYKSTIGVERPLADIENCDLLFVWGWNFLSAIKWIHLAPIFARARMNNPEFEFIYVDPVFNTTAAKANRWVSIRPGTDGALALALCKYLIDSDAVDYSFVAAYTLGFDEFAAYLAADIGEVYDYSSNSSNPAPWADAAGLSALERIINWASDVTGIPTETINAVGSTLVTHFNAGHRICIDAWSGPGHHTNATQGGRAIDCLNLLLGMLDRPGTMLDPLKSGPSRRSKLSTWPAKDGWRPDGRDDVTIPATYTYPDGTTVSNPANGSIKKKYAYSHGSGIYGEMRERMVEQKDFVGNPYPMKAAVVVFQNIMMSVPNVSKNEAAFNAMEFVLCVDTHFSETASMADIVVPGSNYLERFDFNSNWVTFRSVGLRQPVVESWIGGMSETQFFLELGAALGMDGFMTSSADMDDESYAEAEWNKFITGTTHQMSWSDLKTGGTWIETTDSAGATLAAATDGAASTPKSGTHYRKYKATKSWSSGHTESAITVGSETVYVVKDSTGARIGIGTGTSPATFEVGFATDSRRAQFWDPKLAGYFDGSTLVGKVVDGVGGNQSVAGDNRYHPLPWYTAAEDSPASPGAGSYPYYFISWKEVEHTHTRTHNNPWLMEMRGENRLLIPTAIADAKGITEGDWVWVQTPTGLLKGRAHVSSVIQAETVGFVRGFGHWKLGGVAMNKGAHDGWVLPGKAELHSGQAVNKETACQIYKEV